MKEIVKSMLLMAALVVGFYSFPVNISTAQSSNHYTTMYFTTDLGASDDREKSIAFNNYEVEKEILEHLNNSFVKITKDSQIPCEWLQGEGHIKVYLYQIPDNMVIERTDTNRGSHNYMIRAEESNGKYYYSPYRSADEKAVGFINMQEIPEIIIVFKQWNEDSKIYVVRTAIHELVHILLYKSIDTYGNDGLADWGVWYSLGIESEYYKDFLNKPKGDLLADPVFDDPIQNFEDDMADWRRGAVFSFFKYVLDQPNDVKIFFEKCRTTPNMIQAIESVMGSNYETITSDWKKIYLSTDTIIFAPHPDDEALGTSGVIYNELRNNKRVIVVYITVGDGYIYARDKYMMSKGKDEWKKYDKDDNNQLDMTEFGCVRRDEAINAMESLGLSKGNLIWLGYPDSYLKDLWTSNYDCTLTAERTTGKDKVPYFFAETYGASYQGISLLSDLKAILNGFNPKYLYVPHPWDTHTDHSITNLFVSEAVSKLALTSIQIYSYLIHYCRHQTNWWVDEIYNDETDWLRDTPTVKDDYSDNTGISSNFKAPHGFPQPEKELKFKEISFTKKHNIIEQYTSQVAVDMTYLMAFDKENEIFWLNTLIETSQSTTTKTSMNLSLIVDDYPDGLSYSGQLTFYRATVEGVSVERLQPSSGEDPQFTDSNVNFNLQMEPGSWNLIHIQLILDSFAAVRFDCRSPSNIKVYLVDKVVSDRPVFFRLSDMSRISQSEAERGPLANTGWSKDYTNDITYYANAHESYYTFYRKDVIPTPNVTHILPCGTPCLSMVLLVFLPAVVFIKIKKVGTVNRKI